MGEFLDPERGFRGHPCYDVPNVSGTGWLTQGNGNRTKIGPADSAGTLSSETAYSYDTLGRLTNEARTGGSANYTKAYSFDSVGNRTALVHTTSGATVVTSYTYNAGEALTALTRRTNGVIDQNRSYEYDAAGQLTKMADAAVGVTKTFGWDHTGHMTQATVDDGTTATRTVAYAYNPAGLRYMRTAEGVTKAWTYQGDNIASVESTASPTVHSVYGGSGLGGVVERHDVDTSGDGSTTSRFYLYNHRGDVVGVSDTSGTLTTAYDYDAYGAVSQSAQSAGGDAPQDDILFTGKDLDEDTGLYYFNARWYDSESGRFVSRTPLAPNREGPYAFCSDNPINRVDLNGWIDFPVPTGGIQNGDLSHGPGHPYPESPPAPWDDGPLPLGPLPGWFPHGAGYWVGGTVGAGGPCGGGGTTGALGAGGFCDDNGNLSAAVFASGGAEVNCPAGSIAAPSMKGDPTGNDTAGNLGAYAGLGHGPYITNAQRYSDIDARFRVVNFNVGLGLNSGFQWARGANGIWMLSISLPGLPGAGGELSSYDTYTTKLLEIR